MIVCLRLLLVATCLQSVRCTEYTQGAKPLPVLLPRGLFSLGTVVRPQDLADLIKSFDSEFRNRMIEAFSRPISKTLEECLLVLSVYDWSKSEMHMLATVSEFWAAHGSEALKGEVSKLLDDVLARYYKTPVLSPQQGQRLYGEVQVFKKLYAERVAPTSSDGASRMKPLHDTDESLRILADLREFYLLAVHIEQSMAYQVSGEEMSDLIDESEATRDQLGALLNGNSPNLDALPALWLKVVAGKNEACRKIGYPDAFSSRLQGSALDAFERSKGRETLVAYTLESSPVARFLRRVYKKVVVEGLKSSLRVKNEELEAEISFSFKAPAQFSLLQLLTGFAIMAEGLLNVRVSIDFEEPLWSESSFVLKVTRPSTEDDPTECADSTKHSGSARRSGSTKCAGSTDSEVVGRIFVQVLTVNKPGNSYMTGTRSRTRPNPDLPGIVLLNFQRLVPKSTSEEPSHDRMNTEDADATDQHMYDAGEYMYDAGEYMYDAGEYMDDTGEYMDDAGEYMDDAGQYMDDAGDHVNSDDVRSDDCDLTSRSLVSLESCRLNERTFNHAFHELAHALHFLLGNLRLHWSAGTNAPTDYRELPSQLFEYFARDWVDFLKGKGFADQPSVIPGELPSLFMFNLFWAMASHGMWLGHSYTNIADLFNDQSLSFGDIERYPPNESFHHDYSAYMIDRFLALMVYSRGDYRRKLWSLFEQHKTSDQRVQSHMGYGPFISGPSNYDRLAFVEALPGEQGMRSFFASGTTSVNFQSFLSIVPGLEKTLDNVDYLEDAIDFDLQVRELQLQIEP